LTREDVVTEREELAKEHEEKPAATFDSTADSEESEFKRFEDLTRKLVNTPKPDKESE
jgi:hypothetical protein